MKADAFPGRALEGSVGQITPKGDPVQKTYRVRIALPDDTPLMIGMTIEANIIIAERPAVLVPARALRSSLVLVLDVVSGAALSVPGTAWALAAMLGAATYFIISADESNGVPT